MGSATHTAFWNGFEKSAVDWFYRNRNKFVGTLAKDLGPGYSPEHLRSYAKNLRPWESKIPYEEAKSDIKRLYDKKTDYEKTQAGLLETRPGSPEEAAYLKKHKSTLDHKILDWYKDHAETATKYRPGDQRFQRAHQTIQRMVGAPKGG